MPPYALEKCITIQWPEFDIEKNSYVIINFTKNVLHLEIGKTLIIFFNFSGYVWGRSKFVQNIKYSIP